MRKHTVVDLDWRFSEGDIPDAETPEFDDHSWRGVNLPHDWSIEGEFSADAQTGKQGGFLPCGFGWYRKKLMITAAQLKKRLFIEFECVYMNSDVWINGQHLGHRCNGYVTFFYELTKYLKAGENIMAVRVDCSSLPNCRWYSGCGIYRHVRLIERDNLSVTHWGTFITTPKVSMEQAQITIAVDLENNYDKECVVRIENEIVDSQERLIARSENTFLMKAASRHIGESKIRLDHPNLWSCESPHLYKAITRIYDDKTLKDEYETSFGVRDIEFAAEKGFLLNGRKVLLKGLNIHHDLGCLGAAAHDRAIERRLQVIKNTGFNAVRLSHNPHAPYLLDCCDRMGLLVFNECFDKWKDYQAENGEKTYAFEDSWRDDLSSFILRDRNHPSVFIWSVGNETSHQFGQSFWEGPMDFSDYGVKHLKEKTALVKSLDPTRKSTCALYPARQGGVKHSDEKFDSSEPAEMAFAMDIVSSNYLQKFYSRDHERYPQMIFIASEVTTNGGAMAWFSVDHEYCCGIFFWGGIDYIGESTTGWPLKGWATGLIDLCDNPKPASYYAKSMFTADPMVHIGIYNPEKYVKNPGAVNVEWNDVQLDRLDVQSHWNWSKGETLKLVTYTNCDEVGLFLNNRDLGRKRLCDADMNLIEWVVPFEGGTLTAVGYKNGKIAAEHFLATAGKTTQLNITSPRKILQADRMDILHLSIEALDESGRVNPLACDRVHFSINGPAEIIGVDNGDMFDVEPFFTDNKKLSTGMCMAVIRSTGEEGAIEVTATADSINQAIISIMAV